MDAAGFPIKALGNDGAFEAFGNDGTFLPALAGSVLHKYVSAGLKDVTADTAELIPCGPARLRLACYCPYTDDLRTSARLWALQ